MKTVEVTLYAFDELEEKAQEHVVTHWRDNDSFPWGDEWTKSLEAFCRWVCIPGRLVDWQISTYGHSYARLTPHGVGWARELEGGEITSIPTDGSCPLTGYIGDEHLIDGIREAPDGASFVDVVQACLASWARGYLADFEYWLSEEGVREDIAETDDELWFTENGTLWGTAS